jgi:hypothetical protein
MPRRTGSLFYCGAMTELPAAERHQVIRLGDEAAVVTLPSAEVRRRFD